MSIYQPQNLLLALKSLLTLLILHRLVYNYFDGRRQKKLAGQNLAAELKEKEFDMHKYVDALKSGDNQNAATWENMLTGREAKIQACEHLARKPILPFWEVFFALVLVICLWLYQW